MKIVSYIKKNWDKLPKSTFNDEEVVIFFCERDDNEGYGHHSYKGFGVDKNGETVECSSSGCSCSGSCYVEIGSFCRDILNICWKDVNFKSLEVSFRDY